MTPYPAQASPRPPSVAEQSIFSATEDLLRTTPLGELTVEQILQRAGVSRTTFYKRFGSKFAVVSTLLGRLQSELVDVMRPWFSHHDSTPAIPLHAAITAVAELWARHRPIFRACSENWHAEPEVGTPWTAMMDRFTADIAQKIDDERAGGGAPAGVDSTSLARTLVWSSERMLHLAGLGVCGPGHELEAVDALVSIWLGAIYCSADGG